MFNPETSKISGIIDFGGSGLGNPAYDFAGILSSYGEEFFEMCINLYPYGNEISERVNDYDLSNIHHLYNENLVLRPLLYSF